MKRNRVGLKISLLFIVPCFLLWLFCGGIWATSYILAIVFHELSHVYVARLMGLDTARVCLNIYGCKAEINGLDSCSIGTELPIALAGPLFNFMVAIICALLSQVLYFWYYPIMGIAVGNLLLGCFNMLPALPLDGGRALRSLLCTILPRGKGTKICVNISIIIGTSMLAAFGYYAYYRQYKVFLALLGIFIILGAISEQKKVSKYRLGIMMDTNRLNRPKQVRRYAISCEDDLRTALSYFRDDCFNVVDIVTKEGNIQKTMTEIELKKELLR